jgi:hypothetical protein
MTDQQVMEIIDRYRSGLTRREVAAKSVGPRGGVRPSYRNVPRHLNTITFTAGRTMISSSPVRSKHVWRCVHASRMLR